MGVQLLCHIFLYKHYNKYAIMLYIRQVISVNKTVEELWKAIVILPNRDKRDLYKKIQEDVNSNLYKLFQEIKEVIYLISSEIVIKKDNGVLGAGWSIHFRKGVFL